jgi:hypothetical protein
MRPATPAFAAPPALAAFAAAMLLARPLGACEPEALNAHLTAVCQAALTPAEAALAAALPQATPAERAAAERHLALAHEACDSGDPEEGGRTAARLSRLAGRIEGRAGVYGLPGLDLAALPAPR